MKHHKLNNYFERAYQISKLSPDNETKVGCIAIKPDGTQIGSGYNGFIKGADDDFLPKSRPKKYEYIIHAEQNLIAQCAKHGISLDGCVVICTLSPCIHCCRLLWQSGVTEIYYKEKYRDFDKQKNMKDLRIGGMENQNYGQILLSTNTFNIGI